MLRAHVRPKCVVLYFQCTVVVKWTGRLYRSLLTASLWALDVLYNDTGEPVSVIASTSKYQALTQAVLEVVG